MASGPAIAAGKVFVGSNNRRGYVARLSRDRDLACLLCFRESDGKFLWQFASERLPTGRVQDWSLNALASTPYVEGDRLWMVTNRNEVVCLDVDGFADSENDGPYRDETTENLDEADVVWKLDLREQFRASPDNLARSSITAAGDLLFVGTSNGVDEGHVHVPRPDAPSLVAIDKNSGRVRWSYCLHDRILHGQWSSPSLGTLAGRPQVLYGGGDGWLYAFQPSPDSDKQQPLWQFDCNSGRTALPGGGRLMLLSILGALVVADDRVYCAIGEEPEHGEGPGCVWCLDPGHRGIVSAETDRRPNANSAVVWKYEHFDLDGDGRISFEETMHRAVGSPVIQDGLLVVADFSGLLHCLDAKSGRLHWTHDLLAACQTTPLVGGGRIYVGDEDGDIAILNLAAEKQLLGEVTMPDSILGAPVTAGGVLYVLTRGNLWAIEPSGP